MKKLQEGALKADNTPYSAEEIKAHNDLYDMMKSVADEQLAGFLEASKAQEKVLEALKTQNSELQKQYKEVFDRQIKQGLAMQQKTTNEPLSIEKQVNDLLDSNVDAIKSLFENKSGSVKLVVKAAGAMTSANTPITSNLTGAEMQSFRLDSFFNATRQDRQYIFDVADRTTVAKVDEYIIFEEEGTSEGTVAVVAEGVVKPLVDFEIVENKSKAKKAAGKIIITTEFEKFRKRQYQIIKSLFNDKIMRDYQNKLTTDLIAAATGYIGTTMDGTITTPTDIHAIGAVCAQLETLNFNPDVLVINPQDKWRIATSQSAGDGNFFFANIPVTGASGQVQMMGMNVVTTNKMPAGEALIAEGKTWKIEDENVTLKMVYGLTTTSSGGNITSAESDADHNRMRIIGELFFHSYIPSNYAGSVISFNFDDVKGALEA